LVIAEAQKLVTNKNEPHWFLHIKQTAWASVDYCVHLWICGNGKKA